MIDKHDKPTTPKTPIIITLSTSFSFLNKLNTNQQNRITTKNGTDLKKYLRRLLISILSLLHSGHLIDGTLGLLGFTGSFKL
jgi:hypothetical protein